MIKSKFKKGEFVKGTVTGSRYYKKCDENLTKAQIIDIEVRKKSVMITIKVIEHKEPSYVGKKFLVNQNYMQKTTEKLGYSYDYENNLVKDEDTIMIDGKIHAKGLNAFNVRGNWYSKDSDRIGLDSNTGKYELTDYLIRGVVGKNLKTGYFSTVSPYVTCIEGNTYMNKETALDNNLVECLYDGFFYKEENKASMPKSKIAFSENRDRFQNYFKTENLSSYRKVIPSKIGEDSTTYLITGGYSATFGVELETSRGKLPQHVVKEKHLNVKCMRDGSIKGGEYVTGVLKGDRGFENLHKTVLELSRRCAVDNTTGVHVHIGGVDYDKNFIVFAHMLAQSMEKEIQSIIPSTRRGDSNLDWGSGGGRKYKDFCKNLYNIDYSSFYEVKDEMTIDLWDHYIEKYYGQIYGHLSGGHTYSKGDKLGVNHPKISGTNRWISERYYWFNLLPAMFSRIRSDENNTPIATASFKKSQTIEFRNHPGSLNYDKIKNWILICMAFTKFVQDKKEYILENHDKEISLEVIIDHFFDNNKSKAKDLKDYVSDRKSKFIKPVSKSYDKYDLITKEKSLKTLCV